MKSGCYNKLFGYKVIMDSGDMTVDQFLTETEASENIIDYLYNDYNLTSKVKASDKITTTWKHQVDNNTRLSKIFLLESKIGIFP